MLFNKKKKKGAFNEFKNEYLAHQISYHSWWWACQLGIQVLFGSDHSGLSPFEFWNFQFIYSLGQYFGLRLGFFWFGHLGFRIISGSGQFRFWSFRITSLGYFGFVFFQVQVILGMGYWLFMVKMNWFRFVFMLIRLVYWFGLELTGLVGDIRVVIFILGYMAPFWSKILV